MYISMNFKENMEDLRQLLRKGTTKTSKGKNKATYQMGTYMFTRDFNDNHTKVGVSYGSGGVYTRLKSYKICYSFPDEFYIQKIIISQTSDDAKEVERLILKSKRLKILENKGASKEWKIYNNTQVLNNVIKSVLDRNPNIWSHIIVFNVESWKIIRNTGHALKGLSRPSLRVGKKALLS
jgi:hypothetical protein